MNTNQAFRFAHAASALLALCAAMAQASDEKSIPGLRSRPVDEARLDEKSIPGLRSRLVSTPQTQYLPNALWPKSPGPPGWAGYSKEACPRGL